MSQPKIPGGGQSIIEFIIAMALASIFLPALLTGVVTSREGKAQQQQRLEAATLVKEAQEAVRIVRESGWLSFATNGTFHPVKTSTSWSLVEGSETIDGFTRSITITDVYRDLNGNIVTSGGTLDPATKKVAALVSWNTPISSSVTSTMYLSRFLDNATLIHTTDTDFNGAGSIQDNTIVTNTSGGEVTLSAAGPGRGDWCQPKIVGQLDLPRQGEARAITAIPFEAFAGTGINASGVSFADVIFTNPAYPASPSASIAGTVNGYKTNDVFGEEGYAYLATDTNAKEVVIISTSSFSETGYFNIPGVADASSVFVLGTTGYTAAANNFYTFDLSSKTGSRTQLATIQLAEEVTSIYVIDIGSNKYAFVSIDNSTNQLQIIDVTNPSSLSVVGTLTVNGRDGQNVYVSADGNRAYLVTETSAAQPEFFIINTTNKTNPALVSATSVYDTNGMNPKVVNMVLSGNRALIGGTNGEEYQVVDIHNESSPIRCGGLNDDTGVYDVSSVVEPDGDAYSYTVTGQASSELKIIEGGPGGQYSLSGVYESPPLPDPGTKVLFNNFSTTITKPAQTDIKFKLAITDAVDGSCNGATYTFFGPDSNNPFSTNPDNFFTTATTGTSPYSVSWPIPYVGNTNFQNPGRCVKYQAYFSTADPVSSATLYDITFNYSP